jgi:hypothetical protein
MEVEFGLDISVSGFITEMGGGSGKGGDEPGEL